MKRFVCENNHSELLDDGTYLAISKGEFITFKMNHSMIKNSTMAIHTPTVGVENLYPALIECFGIIGLGYLAGR